MQLVQPDYGLIIWMIAVPVLLVAVGIFIGSRSRVKKITNTINRQQETVYELFRPTQ